MIRHCTIPAHQLPPCRREEVLRYAGAIRETEGVSQLLDTLIPEAEGLLSCRVCWREAPVVHLEAGVELEGFFCNSSLMQKRLSGCSRCVLFAATLGVGLDRRIARYGKASPAKALLLQAIGAERIEALCDMFCESISLQYIPEHTGPRFSPGYGDLPLTFQSTLFHLLDCSRQIGVTLSNSLMMSPSKSVTAIMGIGSCRNHTPHHCSLCEKTDCIYRRSL